MPDGEPTRSPVIEERLAGELSQHRGKWVAIDQGALVAVADSAAEVRERALEKGVTDPLVFRVPAHPDRVAFL